MDWSAFTCALILTPLPHFGVRFSHVRGAYLEIYKHHAFQTPANYSACPNVGTMLLFQRFAQCRPSVFEEPPHGLVCCVIPNGVAGGIVFFVLMSLG